MSKLTVYDMEGASVGDLSLDDGLLNTEKGGQAVHDVVVALRAAARSGTASTLAKGEVAGSNRKPWRQKGTGRARAGYRQSPVWRGGSVVFGPKPRSHAVKTNKKVARVAFRRALGEKVAAGSVRVLESLTLPEAKTKLFAALMKALDVRAPALFVVDELDRNAALAARNIPGVEMTLAKDLNVYQLLRYPAVVVTRGGMDVVMKRVGGNGGGKA